MTVPLQQGRSQDFFEGGFQNSIKLPEAGGLGAQPLAAERLSIF